MKYIASVIFFFSFLNIIADSSKDVRSVKWISQYKITQTDSTERIVLTILIPQSIENRQTVEEIIYSLPPSEIIENDGNKYARFIIENTQMINRIDILVSITLYRCDLNTLSKKKNFVAEEDSVLSKFLVEEKWIESNDEKIQLKASQLKSKKVIKTIENIYNYVTKNVKYAGYISQTLGAKYTLENLKGDCTEFSDLFTALCRADSIPARKVIGYTTDWLNVPEHECAEFYLDGIGWVPVDPTSGNSSSFKKLKNRYIYFTNKKSDPMLNNFFYYGYRYWGSAPKIKNTILIR